MRNEECKEERKYQIERENKCSKSMVIGMNRKDIKEEKVDVSKSYYFSNKEWKDIESVGYNEKKVEDEKEEKVCKEEVNGNEEDNNSNEEGSKEDCEWKDERNVSDDSVKESSVKEKEKEKEDKGINDEEDTNIYNGIEDKKEEDVVDDKEKEEKKEEEIVSNKEEEKEDIINDKKEEKKEMIVDIVKEKKEVVDDKEEEKDINDKEKEKEDIIVDKDETIKEELRNDKQEEKKEVINDKEKEKNDIKTSHEKEAVIIIEDTKLIPPKDLIIELDSPKKENKTYTNIKYLDKDDNEFINIDLPITDNKKPKLHNSTIIENKKPQTTSDTTNKEENKILILDTPSPKKQNDIIILESPNDQQDSPSHKENNQVLILDSPPIQSKTFIKPTSPKNKDNQDTLNKLNKTSIVDGNESSHKSKIKQNVSSITQENQNEYQFIDLSAIEKQFDPDEHSNKNDNIKENETNNNNTSKLISPIPSSSQVYPSLNASAFKSIDPNTSTFHNINKIDTNPPIQVATIPLLNPYQNTNTNTNTNTSPPLYQEIKNISSYPDQNHPIICGDNTNNSNNTNNNNEVTSNNKVNISKILNEHYFPEPKAANINYIQNQIPPPGISNLNSTSNVLNFYMNLMDNVDEVASSSPPTTFNYYQIKEISEISDLVSSYKLYEISYINNKTKQREIKCFRRYDNFFQFHQKVKKKYPTIIIPKLPPKNPLAKIIKLQDSFFEKRRLQLIFYLNFICKHPGLNKTKELFKFLTDAEFDVNYFKVTQDDEPIPPSSLSTSETIKNTFYLMWNSISAGTKARYIPNEENLLKKYETHFQNILKRYQDVQCSITEYLQSVTKENKEYENMSSVFDFLKESFINVNNSKQNLIKYSKHCETVSKTTYEETMNIEKLDNKLNAVISLNEGICDSLKKYCTFVERFESVLKLKEIATKNKWDKVDVILNEYDACLNHKGMLEKSLVKDTGDYIKLFDDFTSQIFDEFKMILIKINNKNTEEEK